MKYKSLVTCYHGSRLYGLAHENSDIDLYNIYAFNYKNYRPRKQSSQTITDKKDINCISLDKFNLLVFKGVPQALEALFSPPEFWLEYDKKWVEISDGLQLQINNHMSTILDTYRRTIINFMQKDDFKKNRHGFRLLINMSNLKLSKRFNPCLAANQINDINKYAKLPWSQKQEQYKSMLFDIMKGIT